jgi:hypothetical protein
MAVFSKFFNCLNYKMWLVGDLTPPLSVPTVLGTFIICVISFYIFKWLSGDGNVPIRDSTKNHSWTPIKIASKVLPPDRRFPNFNADVPDVVLLHLRILPHQRYRSLLRLLRRVRRPRVRQKGQHKVAMQASHKYQ